MQLASGEFFNEIQSVETEAGKTANFVIHTFFTPTLFVHKPLAILSLRFNLFIS